MGTLLSNAQYFNYNTAAGWSPNIRNVYSATTCTGSTPVTTPHTTVPTIGSIAVNTSTGRVEFTNVRSAHESRISYPLGTTTYDQNYTVDFDFNVSSILFTGPSVYLVGLTAQNKNLFYDIPMITCGAAPVMDALAIGCTSAANGNFPYIFADTWDEGVRVTTNTATIPIAYNTTYYARTRVYNNGMGELFLYSNQPRTILVGRICFSIPTTINQLSFLQHAIHSGGGTARETTAWVDNTDITQNSSLECCNILINGPNVICYDPSHPITQNYTVTTTGTGVSYSVSPSDVGYTVNSNGSITINNWGTMPSANPKVITITATAICQCEEISTTKTIYLYKDLDASFNIVGLSSSGGNLSNFSAVSTAGSSTTLHQWEIMSSNSSSVPGALVRPVYTSTGTGSTFSVNSSTPTQLVTGAYYLVRHTMSNQSGLCGPAVSTRLIFISSGMKLIDLGEISESGFTKDEIERKVEDFQNGIESKSLKVSPNPTSGKVNIQSESEIQSVILMDASGKIIETVNKRGNEISLDLSSLQRGAYLVKVVTEGGTQLERIVKQ